MRRMKNISRFKNENWSYDMAYVDELTKNNKGVEFLLVRQDLYVRPVVVKRLKAKDFKKFFEHFKYIY